MRWLLKWAVQKSISLLPDNQSWNYLFQRWVTKSLVPQKEDLVRHFSFSGRHLTNYQQFSGSQSGPARVLELGTGWMPTVCVGLWLCGVDEIHTIDVQDLKRSDVINTTLSVLNRFTVDELHEVMPLLQPERFERLQRMLSEAMPTSQVFDAMGIHFLIGDAGNMPFLAQSIECIISNATLEHIPQTVIVDIFREFRRIAAPGAVMSHLIDEADHYSHFDSSITPYHFLQHEDLAWKLINNPILYMNRLRVSDYREIHHATGFRILQETNIGYEEMLEQIRLARAFRYYSRADLVPVESWFVSSPA